MERFLKTEGWLDDHAGRFTRKGQWLSDTGARHSPLMRAAAARCINGVEASLRSFPSYDITWLVWVELTPLTEGHTLKSLLGSLEAKPGKRNWPNILVEDNYLQGLWAAKDWQSLKDYLQLRWEKERERKVSASQSGEIPEGVQNPLETNWKGGTAGRLIEAYLGLGDLLGAEQVLKESCVEYPSREVPRWAADLATACGQTALAARWVASVSK